jgi:hypothetical protein
MFVTNNDKLILKSKIVINKLCYEYMEIVIKKYCATNIYKLWYFHKTI